MGLRDDEVVLLAVVVILTTPVCDGAIKYGRCSSLCTSIKDRIELYWCHTLSVDPQSAWGTSRKKKENGTSTHRAKSN